MDVSMGWKDRQQSSERQRLEYGVQTTWEKKKKKMQKKIPKISTDTLESLIAKLHISGEWNIWVKVKNDY